jgi:ectoine hydroxylase-related dioxygenase (phytanoyl-CoA dioxygenase family)
MRVPDHNVDEFFERGFTLVEGFLSTAEVETARAALWQTYPRPEDYFANPGEYAHLQAHAFAGNFKFPFADFELNRLAVHDDLADVARRILDSPEVRLYKGEVWAKYGGGVDYTQPHHRDFGNHMLVVPRADGYRRDLLTYIYLSDVDETTGATAIVPLEHGRHIPLGVNRLDPGELVDHEVRLGAPAGSLVLYSTDVFHRGTAITDPTGSRFMVLADYRRADAPWIQMHAFGLHGNRPEMREFVSRASAEQRTLLDIPAPGHEYWNAQTIADMAIRYPGIDMSPYEAALPGG